MERKAEKRRAERNGGRDASTGLDEQESDTADDLEDAGPPVSREEINRRRLVRRAHVTTIVTAWVTTVPAAALLAAGIFLILDVIA
jgi:PiT family inorganic phosphate transporter